MIKNSSITFKLIGGFIIVALITATVGIIGFQGINAANEDIHTLGRESIPSIVNLEIVKVSYLEIKVAMRTLLSPFLSADDARRQFANIDKARSNYQKAFADYESIEMVAEEKKLHETVKEKMKPLMELNNQFLKLAEPLEGNISDKDRTSLSRQLTVFVMKDNGQREAFDGFLGDLQTLLDFVKHYYGEQTVVNTEKEVVTNYILIITASVIGFILALALGIFISRSIAQPVAKITNDLFSSAGSLESAAGQVSSSSQELSSGASELASSVEEMTSSLEELQSIIESNTRNVNEAEMMMKTTLDSSNQVTTQMNGMQIAMKEINENSKKIEKIIKAIDDIAFQTNILALNAAVEAARAGDAGRGFAVVADQVKSLANKSAEAAKETADLIEKAIDSVAKGERIGNEVVDLQKKSSDLSGKVGTLLDEVNKASKEQLKGANQVTKAVSQINTVVQQTASSSEETASAGEELLSQAEMTRDVVNKLNGIVKGAKAAEKTAAKQLENRGTKKAELEAVHTNAKKLEHHSLQLSHKEADEGVEIVRPEDKIPLQDFKDF